MKTAVVMEIEKGYALLMKAGGGFTKVRAHKSWAKGDIVTFNEKSLSMDMKMIYAAACCLLLFFGSFGGYRLYSTETALISMDINPSIELRLNTFDRVIATAYYNEDGAYILSSLDIKGKKADDALNALFKSDVLQPYLMENQYLDIAVSGNERLQEKIDILAQALTAAHGLQVSCHGTDKETVAQAHGHGMTPGKYLMLLELQSLEPEIDIRAYASCGMGQIHGEIEARHSNARGHGNGYGRERDYGAEADSSREPQAQGRGHGHGQGGPGDGHKSNNTQ